MPNTEYYDGSDMESAVAETKAEMSEQIKNLTQELAEAKAENVKMKKKEIESKEYDLKWLKEIDEAIFQLKSKYNNIMLDELQIKILSKLAVVEFFSVLKPPTPTTETENTIFESFIISGSENTCGLDKLPTPTTETKCST